MQTSVASQASVGGTAARLHYLDWLRLLATLGVFVFHAVHPFDFFGWHIKNAEQSMAVTIFIAFFFSWGMPFFFMIAGAGSWFALRRRRASQFIRERFNRLAIPFVVGSLLLTPVMFYFEWSHKFQTNVFEGSFQDFLNARVLYLDPRFFGAVGYHLWFLGFLFCFALLALPIFRWLSGETGKSMVARIARLCERRGAILLFAIPLVLVRLVFHSFAPEEHNWADFFFQMSYFVLGYILFTDERFLQAVRRDWPMVLTIGIVTTTVAMVMGTSSETFNAEAPIRTPWDFLFWSLVSINSWCWSLVMFFVGMRFLEFSNKWVRYGQEAILPFFVFHQVVIIIIAYFVVQWDSDILPKLVAVVFGSFVVTLGLYELIVRRVSLLRVAFGMKPRRLSAAYSV